VLDSHPPGEPGLQEFRMISSVHVRRVRNLKPYLGTLTGHYLIPTIRTKQCRTCNIGGLPPQSH